MDYARENFTKWKVTVRYDQLPKKHEQTFDSYSSSAVVVVVVAVVVVVVVDVFGLVKDSNRQFQSYNSDEKHVKHNSLGVFLRL